MGEKPAFVFNRRELMWSLGAGSGLYGVSPLAAAADRGYAPSELAAQDLGLETIDISTIVRSLVDRAASTIGEMIHSRIDSLDLREQVRRLKEWLPVSAPGVISTWLDRAQWLLDNGSDLLNEIYEKTDENKPELDVSVVDEEDDSVSATVSVDGETIFEDPVSEVESGSSATFALMPGEYEVTATAGGYVTESVTTGVGDDDRSTEIVLEEADDDSSGSRLRTVGAGAGAPSEGRAGTGVGATAASSSRATSTVRAATVSVPSPGEIVDGLERLGSVVDDVLSELGSGIEAKVEDLWGGIESLKNDLKSLAGDLVDYITRAVSRLAEFVASPIDALLDHLESAFESGFDAFEIEFPFDQLGGITFDPLTGQLTGETGAEPAGGAGAAAPGTPGAGAANAAGQAAAWDWEVGKMECDHRSARGNEVWGLGLAFTITNPVWSNGGSDITIDKWVGAQVIPPCLFSYVDAEGARITFSELRDAAERFHDELGSLGARVEADVESAVSALDLDDEEFRSLTFGELVSRVETVEETLEGLDDHLDEFDLEIESVDDRLEDVSIEDVLDRAEKVRERIGEAIGALDGVVGRAAIEVVDLYETLADAGERIPPTHADVAQEAATLVREEGETLVSDEVEIEALEFGLPERLHETREELFGIAEASDLAIDLTDGTYGTNFEAIGTGVDEEGNVVLVDTPNAIENLVSTFVENQLEKLPDEVQRLTQPSVDISDAMPDMQCRGRCLHEKIASSVAAAYDSVIDTAKKYGDRAFDDMPSRDFILKCAVVVVVAIVLLLLIKFLGIPAILAGLAKALASLKTGLEAGHVATSVFVLATALITGAHELLEDVVSVLVG